MSSMIKATPGPKVQRPYIECGGETKIILAAKIVLKTFSIIFGMFDIIMI